MIGFLVWDTGNATYPVVFCYAEGREECKREVATYIRENATRTGWHLMHQPDNWTVEPVTREQDYVTERHVIAPKTN